MVFVEFRLDYPLLQAALGRAPDMEAGWIRNVATDGGRELLFWAQGGDFEAFETGIEADPTVTLVDTTAVGDQRIYRVVLESNGDESAPDLYSVLIDSASFVQKATATHEGWECRFAFPDRSALDRFFRACRERDVGYEIHRIVEGQTVEQPANGLTDPQREALVAALDCEFFEVPRQCTLDDLADRLGVSDTAASMRLRRGMKTLVERAVYPDDTDERTG